jgi:hypothetical protein
MIKSTILLALGLCLVLAAIGGGIYRMRSAEPQVAASQLGSPSAAQDADSATGPEPADVTADVVPVVRHGAADLGGSDAFSCAIESGVRRCRTSE